MSGIAKLGILVIFVGIGPIGGRRRLAALVVPQQAHMRLLEVDERG